MATPKLDGLARQLLESRFAEKQRAEAQRLHETISARAADMAVRRLRQAYDSAQADMPVLAKYSLCSPVKAINFHVYDPATGRFDGKIGVEVDLPGYMIPGASSGYVWLYLGGYPAGVSTENGPYPAHSDHDSPDWRLAREIIALRETYSREQRAAFVAFATEIRSTSSWSKLAKAHPWVEQYAPRAEAA